MVKKSKTWEYFFVSCTLHIKCHCIEEFIGNHCIHTMCYRLLSGVAIFMKILSRWKAKTLPQFNNINSQKREMKWMRKNSFLLLLVELWHGWKSFVYAKKKQLKLFPPHSLLLWIFHSIKRASRNYFNSKHFLLPLWWFFGDAGQRFFNPFYMRKFFESWRRISSIFRWRFCSPKVFLWSK